MDTVEPAFFNKQTKQPAVSHIVLDSEGQPGCPFSLFWDRDAIIWRTDAIFCDFDAIIGHTDAILVKNDAIIAETEAIIQINGNQLYEKPVQATSYQNFNLYLS